MKRMSRNWRSLLNHRFGRRSAASVFAAAALLCAAARGSAAAASPSATEGREAPPQNESNPMKKPADEHSGQDGMIGKDMTKPFTTASTIGDLLAAPEFKGFAAYLLPLETLGGEARLSAAERRMPLSSLARLLPYHSHVDAERSCAILNRMRARAAAGEHIWIPLSRPGAGLFLFPAERSPGAAGAPRDPKAPFVLIAPGGGFVYVGSIHEGFPYAEAMNRNGMNAFVLQYRVSGGARSAMEDMAEALVYIRKNAEALGVDPSGYAVMGSSAGARMVAWIGNLGVEPFGYEHAPKPAAVLMAYTGLSDASADDPPTFMMQGTDDWIAPVRVVDRRMQALKALGVPTDYMRVEGIGHGFGIGDGTPAAGWIDRAAKFWIAMRCCK